MVHILIGQADYFESVTLASPQTALGWVVPKASSVGDAALLYFPSASAVVASAEIQTPPKPDTFGKRKGYSAEIAKFIQLPSPVSLEVLVERFPDWKWPTYPRSYTTVSGELERGLLDLIDKSPIHDPAKSGSPLGNLQALDSRTQTLVRLEQSLLRGLVVGAGPTAPCAFCSRQLPIGFLVVAHIKPRCVCSMNEKRNLNNVLPLCRFGCDELLERSYITVSNGRICRGPEKRSTKALDDCIAALINRECAGWGKNRAPFFQARIDYFERS